MLKKLGLRALFGLACLFMALVFGAGLFLSLGKELGERHNSFDFSDTFNFTNGSFEDYIVFSQKHLQAARAESPSKEFILNASPFILSPGSQCAVLDNGKYANGIVLTHGLLASPYSMRSIAEYFQARCFYVLVPILPDHATRPGDFIDTHWEEWLKVQSFALQILEGKAENIFLSGHSAGATLAVYEAAINPVVDGLILFTPAMEITSAAKYAKYVQWLAALFPKAGWFELREDVSQYRYESVSVSAAGETYALIQVTAKALEENPLSIPVLTVASIEDNTVSTEATLAFMAEQSHQASLTLLYSQQPLDSSKAVKILDSYAPKQGVLSVSHLGIMTASSHLEYGENGAYKNCGHYFGQENDRHEQCKAGQRDYYAEVTSENLEKGLIERIAFNPYFDDLIIELDRFLDSL